MNTSNTDHDVFQTYGPQWWQPDGPFWTLHAIQPIRFGWIKDQIPLTGTALDIGCGGGLMCEDLAKHGLTVTGIDQSPQGIECAKKHSQEHSISIDYRHGLLSDVVKVSEQFDVVCLLEVLEHVNDPKTLLHHAITHLKPGGTLLCSTLNRNPTSFIASIVMAEHILKWLPVGTHQYQQFIKPSEMATWAAEAHLEPIAMTGIRYSISQQSFTLTRSPAINYIMAFRHV